MSSFTFADNKLGGRFTAAADAIAAGKLRTAAGILMEVANELYVEADSADGLMSDVPAEPMPEPEPTPTAPQPTLNSTDLQSCSRGVHQYGSPDDNGWRHCKACGVVNVAPPSGGAIDMSNQALGDL